MRVKTLLAAAFAVSVLTFQSFAQDNASGTFGRALELYNNGMYERARTLFETVADDDLAKAYSVLCAVKLRSEDSDRVYADFLEDSPASPLLNRIHYERALNFFDSADYASCLQEFSAVDPKMVPETATAEAVFKKGYCSYATGDTGAARSCFSEVASMPVGDYTSTSCYLNGYMDYTSRDFASALNWFSRSVDDPRYHDLASFYITDCEFNRRNYDYVLDKGVALFGSVPAERRDRLARMISESYLVKGDKENARRYYDESSHTAMSRSDWFYAGSVLYAVEDYAGAVDNFSRMTDRTDSLGQIANYQMANAYLQLHNNVAAMDAFKAASVCDWDAAIKEDASFNYAKLTFDLNKDASGFDEYIRTYNTGTKGEQIYGYMALAALYNRDYAAAVAAYDNIDELEPGMQNNYVKANYLRAVQLMNAGSWTDAIPRLRAAAYYRPRTDRLNQLSRYWLAESYMRTGNVEEAREIYTDLYNSSALQDRSEGSILPYNIAYTHLKENNYAMAARWFDTYVSEGALLYREDALTRRADCDFARKDYKAAVGSYQKVLSEFFSPGDIYPYWRQALAYGLTGDRKSKVTVLSNVEKASPKSPLWCEAMYELGRTHVDQKSYPDAIRVFGTLKANAADSIWTAKSLIGLGMVERNTGDYDSALDCYKSVVRMLPGSEYAEDALLAIESIYQARKEPEKYLEYVEQNSLNAKATAAEREAMYFNTAEQVFLGGNYQQALASLQRYLDEYPSGSKVGQARFYIAESHKALGDKEKAIEAYSAAIASGADDSFTENARLGYASLCYSIERWDDAYDGYRDLLAGARIDANKSTARVGMMRSAYRGRRFADAVTAASAVLLETGLDKELKREAEYIQAKSYMATSRRAEALNMFRALAADPSTAEGAEAKYILIQDFYDQGRFDGVESSVYEFSQKAGNQSYWLARAYLVLGDSFAARGEKSQARATYESIRDGYSPYGSEDDIPDGVRARLEKLDTAN